MRVGIGCNRLGSVGILGEKYTVTEARFSSLSVSRLCQGLKWQDPKKCLKTFKYKNLGIVTAVHSMLK